MLKRVDIRKDQFSAQKFEKYSLLLARLDELQEEL